MQSTLSSSSPQQQQQSWLVKYQPHSIEDFIDNKGAIEQLQDWLINFELFTSTSTTPIHKPIAYVSGGIGIGKTTLVHLLLKQYGYDIYEINSIDIRSKKQIEEIVERAIGHKNINVFKRKSFCNGKIALIIDDIDGMTCSNKGGLYYLFELIAKMEQRIPNPIICIGTCKNENNVECIEDIELQPPTLANILIKCEEIVDNEELMVDTSVLEAIITYCKQDIRKIIITLQEICDFFKDTPIVHEYLESVMHILEKKEEMVDLFQLTTKLFTERIPLDELYFHYEDKRDLLPLMIYENLYTANSQLMDNLCLCDVIENCVEVQSTNALDYMVCAIKCGEVYTPRVEEPTKLKKAKKEKKEKTSAPAPTSIQPSMTIKFTSNLSNSALYSVNVTLMKDLFVDLSLSTHYIPSLVNLFYNVLKQCHENETDVKQLNMLMGGQNGWFYKVDGDKLLHLYQRWWNVSVPKIKKFYNKLRGTRGT